ncbi:helix-turn-helix domain-containing protein [Hymenobacter rubripertinctus]|uniref:helix-turn-helix domain-containing protein n=1 Tax=Hymenobacter rubripertinctus TaxID=2029981 RepID=UPI003645F1A6
MARALSNAVASNSLAASIRTHFGLTQAELSQYLGISSSQVAHLEAGRRRATPLANLRLTRLAQALPPPDGQGRPAPLPPATEALPAPVLPLPPLPGPLAPALLARRQRQLARRLALLLRDERRLCQQVAAQAHRRWAGPVLAAALAPRPTPDPAGATPTEQAHAQRWLAALAPAPPSAQLPEAATALALLLVRRAALQAEAATLATLPGLV